MPVAPNTAPADYRELSWLLHPGSWRKYWGERWTGAMGLMFDMLAEGAQTAVLVSKIGSKYFSPDALEPLGIERNLPRFPGESDASWTARIKNAWNLWQQAGTNNGIIQMFDLLGITAEIKTNADWDWDSQPANWSRMWVVLTDHGWVSDGLWGDPGVWGDGGTWGSSATVDEVRAVRNIVRLFKPAHMLCVNIVVVLDPVTWAIEQPDGTWNVPANRSESAIYWSV